MWVWQYKNIDNTKHHSQHTAEGNSRESFVTDHGDLVFSQQPETAKDGVVFCPCITPGAPHLLWRHGGATTYRCGGAGGFNTRLFAGVKNARNDKHKLQNRFGRRLIVWRSDCTHHNSDEPSDLKRITGGLVQWIWLGWLNADIWRFYAPKQFDVQGFNSTFTHTYKTCNLGRIEKTLSGISRILLTSRFLHGKYFIFTVLAIYSIIHKILLLKQRSYTKVIQSRYFSHRSRADFVQTF